MLIVRLSDVAHSTVIRSPVVMKAWTWNVTLLPLHGMESLCIGRAMTQGSSNRGPYFGEVELQRLTIYGTDEQEQLALDSAPYLFLPRSNLSQSGDVNTIDTRAFGWSVNNLGTNQLWRSSRSPRSCVLPCTCRGTKLRIKGMLFHCSPRSAR